MSWADEQLVPEDEVERRTRDQFERAAQAALRIVDEAAASGAAAVPWPEAPVSEEPVATPWLVTPLPASPAAAREAGWLVTVPGAEHTRAGSSSPLAGMKVAVKDVIDVAGLPVHNGTPHGLWREPVRSAPVWQRLASAGAACIGKAATHEMAWGVTTPQIGNPHDPERLAGGSSGGSAACVGAGAAHGALGTDTGGSVRIPASLCGVVGLRPTVGSVDMQGITSLAPTQDVAGPIAADVDTCSAMLESMLGRPLRLGTEAASGVRVGVLDPVGALDTATAAALEDTLEALRSAGVILVPCPAELLRLAGAVSLLTMLQESAALHADAVRAEPAAFGGEARALLTLGSALAGQGELVAARATLRHRTAAVFAERAVHAVLSPTTPCTAPPRTTVTVSLDGRAVPVASALTRFTAWASAAGLPAVSVPAPTPGLPVGMQLMAPPYREELCLLLGRVVETSRRRTA